MEKLTKEQKIVLSGFTGILCCKLSDFQKDVEKRMGRPVFTHEFGSPELMEEIKELYTNDFMELVKED